MKIMVNGQCEELERSVTIAEYLELNAIDTKLVVVEWNFTTPQMDVWDHILLNAGDNLEIIKIVGGG